jgi:hypothetical protein
VVGLYLVTWGQVEHRKQDAIEAAEQTSGDVESAPDHPQLTLSSSSSDLTQPLLSGGEVGSEDQQQQRSRLQVAAPRTLLTIPRQERRRSFCVDEESALLLSSPRPLNVNLMGSHSPPVQESRQPSKSSTPSPFELHIEPCRDSFRGFDDF